MRAIPLHVKISLINKYIQNNYLKTRGKSEHEEYLISKILENIIEDLNEHDRGKNSKPDEFPMDLIIRDLKYLRDKERNITNTLGSVIEELKTLQDIKTDPSVNLDEILKKLESFGK